MVGPDYLRLWHCDGSARDIEGKRGRGWPTPTFGCWLSILYRTLEALLHGADATAARQVEVTLHQCMSYPLGCWWRGHVLYCDSI